ncbi:MAG: D-alanyl-D-alanine carboxypeptidase, partial [Alphaproteobacteria bacterium]|nr:D-alanyl-D-alanine carboxypeptidase [Alphaproteobacteria bacterium]
MIRKFLLASAVVIICNQTSFAYNTEATHAILMDFDTGAVLFSKMADQPMVPSSMSKLMTAYVVFQALRDGRITEDSMFMVSDNAFRHGGPNSSLMFLERGQLVSVADLLKGIIVVSGNDAAMTLAENIAGTEAEFVKMMNLQAAELGLRNSNFMNSTGLHHNEQVMSARDLAVLSKALMRDFPEHMPLFVITEFEFNRVRQSNRNHLLFSIPAQAEGLKTGHTRRGGFGLVGAARSRDGTRRLIMVINGLRTQPLRARESLAMMTYGMRQFDNYTLFQDEHVFDNVQVFMGDTRS